MVNRFGNRLFRFFLLAGVFFLVRASVATGQESQPAAASDFRGLSAEDWPWWRGPSRNGIAPTAVSIPTSWSETENVRWGVPVAGRGHGSPAVVGDQVLLATAEPERDVQSVVCFDRKDGKVLWRTDVHRGGLGTKGNAKTSLASATVACDGERLFVNFLNSDSVFATALDRHGKQLWQTRIDDFVVHQGYGASPTVYGPFVFVSADHKGGGVVAALDRKTGKIVWKRERPAKPNYTSPILLSVAGRDQLLLAGCDLVTGLDPLSGRQLWETTGATTECVTSIVTDGQRIFVSGGYPRNHVAAVRADGSGTLDWENNSRVYVPSMIVRDGFLYAMQDAGIATCWESASGKEIWKERLGGTFSSSLVMAGENLLATDESGRTIVFGASPERFTKIAENQLGDECLATPAVSRGELFYRVAKNTQQGRQEWLYCLGNR